MKTVYLGSPDKTEVSGSSPEWPTIVYGRQNSYFLLRYPSWCQWHSVGLDNPSNCCSHTE